MAEAEVARTKLCEGCGRSFDKPKKYSWAQWGDMRFCGIACRPKTIFFTDRHGRTFLRDRNRNGTPWARVVMEDLRDGSPLPRGSVVHHLNGDCSDDRPENLALCASQSAHRRLHVGEASSNAKLTGQQVRELRAKYRESGLGPFAFASRVCEDYGVRRETLWTVLKGQTWREPEYWP